MKQSAPASEAPELRVGAQAPRAHLWIAWALVALFAGVVLWLGTPNFSHSQSYPWLLKILRFFDPEVKYPTVMAVHDFIRKAMHVVVYAILALLAFRASWLSFGNLLMRVSMTALLVALGVALVDETRQAHYASRSGSGYDVVIDGMGAAAAVGLAGLALRQRLTRRREQSRA